MSSKWPRSVRLRMEAAGEKYTTALRWLHERPEEALRLRNLLREARLAQDAAGGIEDSE